MDHLKSQICLLEGRLRDFQLNSGIHDIVLYEDLYDSDNTHTLVRVKKASNIIYVDAVILFFIILIVYRLPLSEAVDHIYQEFLGLWKKSLSNEGLTHSLYRTNYIDHAKLK